MFGKASPLEYRSRLNRFLEWYDVKQYRQEFGTKIDYNKAIQVFPVNISLLDIFVSYNIGFFFLDFYQFTF